MNWQVKYALANLNNDRGPSTAEHVHGDVIRVSTTDQPDVLAVISAAETIDEDTAVELYEMEPNMDFLCGFKQTCVWDGGAIAYLEKHRVGWGSFGTLWSAVRTGKANTSAHKEFSFADRLYRQTRIVAHVEREYDRVHKITLKNGSSLRIGMISEYEPTADAVRTLWDRFGPVQVAWNINPNGDPTKSALEAGNELGCEVLKWTGLKDYMQKV